MRNSKYIKTQQILYCAKIFYFLFSVAKATLEWQMSIHLSVRLKSIPLNTSLNCSYWPTSLSTIKPIGHLAYWTLSLLTIEPIDHRTYQPLSLSYPYCLLTYAWLSQLLSHFGLFECFELRYCTLWITFIHLRIILIVYKANLCATYIGLSPCFCPIFTTYVINKGNIV